MIVSMTYWWSYGAPSKAKAKPSTKMTEKKRFCAGLAVAAVVAAFLGGVAAHDGDGGVGAGGLRGPPRDQVGPPAAPGLALGGVLPPGGGGAPPSPQGVELQDALPQDGRALLPPDEAGPVVVRRLQVDPDDGWTLTEGAALPGHNKLDVRGEAGDDSPVVDARQCKEMCQSLHWCKNIDMKTSDGYPRCLLSDLSADDVDAVGLDDDSNNYDHYSLDRAQNDIAQAIAPPSPLWTPHPGKALSGENKLDLRGEAGDDFPFMDVTQCKAMCMRLDWCVNFDMAASGRRCILSDVVVGEDGLAPSGSWDHYTLDRAQIVLGAELEAEREANAALRQRIESLEADNADLREDLEAEREANEEAVATQREEIRAQLSTTLRQLLSTYTPSEYHRRLSQGDPATAVLDDLVQDLCYRAVRDFAECQDSELRYGDDTQSLIPYCDVSAVTSFTSFFVCPGYNFIRHPDVYHSWNPDISHWNVASGIDFQLMFKGMPAFRRDLSLWRIPYSSERMLTGMFYHTEMDNIHHCPCVQYEYTDGYFHVCPGKEELNDIYGWIECEAQEPADQADPSTPLTEPGDGVQELTAQWLIAVQDLIGELATCNTHREEQLAARDAALATCNADSAALINDLVRQFLLTYPPSEYNRQLNFGDFPVTAFINTFVQERCGSAVRFRDCVEANSHDLQQGPYWPEDTLSLIPYCDVSAVTSFQDFFQCGYGADFNPGDLSQWSIHCHADVDNPGVCTSDVTNMLQGTSVSHLFHCPCIEGAPDTWRRWCPGLGNLEHNPSSWQNAVELADQYSFYDCSK